MQRRSQPDPITLEIIQSSLQADERRDVRGVPQDRDERDHLRGARHGHRHHRRATASLASSGAGIPAFVGVLDKAVKRIIELNDEPGDDRARATSSSTNDPFYGGVTHLNDVVLAMPVFADGDARSRGRRTSRTGTTSAAWCRARSRPTRARSSRRACAFPASSSSPAGSPIESVMRDHRGEQPPARLPPRGHVGRDRRGARRRAAPARPRRASTASRPSSSRSTTSWTTARRSR